MNRIIAILVAVHAWSSIQAQSTNVEKNVTVIERQSTENPISWVENPGKPKVIRPKIARSFSFQSKPEMQQGPWLGVHVNELSHLVSAQLGLTPGMGLAVEHVVPGSPAAEAGLKRHDILTHLSNQTLIKTSQLQVLVRSNKPGTTVPLTLLRKGKKQIIKATIQDRKMPKAASYIYHYNGGEGDVVIEGADPVVVHAEIAERMNDLEKDVLADVVTHGDVSALKHGLHTRMVFLDNHNMVLSDDTGTYNLRTEDGKKRLVVLNPDGNTLYKGEIVNEASLEGLPEAIRKKVLELTGKSKPEQIFKLYKKSKHGKDTDGDVLGRLFFNHEGQDVTAEIKNGDVDVHILKSGDDVLEWHSDKELNIEIGEENEVVEVPNSGAL